MESFPTTEKSTLSEGITIFLNGKQLAEALDVSPPSLSEAVKKGYNCAGYPVGEWALFYDSGRIKGYDVPEFLVSGESQKPEKRTNPQELTPNKANSHTNKGEKPVNQAQSVTHNNYSIFPEGEDYIRPAGMITLPMVLKKALEKDTPQSRAVIAGGLTGIGAIIGQAVTDRAAGAGIGALIGLGISYVAYQYYKPATAYPSLPRAKGSYNQTLPVTQLKQTNQSQYLPN